MDLESQRLKLLTSIQELEQIDAPEQREIGVLQKLKQEYNQIMEALAYQERGNTRLDPLVKFPPEIWISIIQNAISFRPYLILVGPPPRLETLCSYILVSKRWYKCLTETPILWTSIELNDSYSSGQDTAVLLATFLHLSRACMLDVTIWVPFTSWPLVCDRIAKHRSRINSVSFRTSGLLHAGSKYNRKISNILHFLSPLPHLTRLWGVYDSIQWLLDEGTLLEYIGSESISLNMLSSSGTRNLRQVHTTEDIRAVIPLMRNLPLAQDISFTRIPMRRGVNINDIHFIEPRDIDFSGRMTLAWTSLTYNRGLDHFPVWLLTRLPHLVTLRLDLWSVQLALLLRTVNCLTCLHYLSIEISWGETLPALPSETITPCPSLYELHITDSHATRHETTEYFVGLSKILVKIFGNVDNLVMRGRRIGTAYMSIRSDGFQKLRRLAIATYSLRAHTSPLFERKAWFPPSLRELYIAGEYFTQLYESPTIEHLSLSPNSHIHVEQELSINGWPKLQKLTIRLSNVLLKNEIHQNLRDLRLSGYMYDDNCTSFCRYIALYPSNLPSLRSIALDQVPEWDIFFLMLERKNFSIQPGVARITRVHLPDSCPERFLKPLKDLLSGIYTERPSNLDLSIVGNVDIIFDISISGCIGCHRALRLCTMEWNAPTGLDELRSSVPSYPENPQDILLTWEKRAAWWRDVNKSGLVRKISCNQLRRSRLEWIVSHADDEDVEYSWV